MAVSLELTDFGGGSFIAEGISYVYSYSANGGNVLMSTKDGAFSLDLKPPYSSPESAIDFVKSLEKASQIKALQMSENKTLDSMDLVRNGDVAERDIEVLMRETASIAEMSQLVENDDMIRFAEKLCEYTPLRGIDISRCGEHNERWQLNCSTLLGNEIEVEAFSGTQLLAKTSQVLEELQQLTKAFMNVMKPPLITSPAEKIIMTSRVLDPREPEMSYAPSPSAYALPESGRKIMPFQPVRPGG